jgi:RNA-directed DNA polymerase
MKKVNWVLDADVHGFFSAMSHDWTLRFLEHRIADKRILRLIAKWLKVGVIIKDGHIECSTRGAPQGAVVSPILANIYLHYAFDLWAHRWRQQNATNRFFPPIKILHPQPLHRFDARTRGRSPVR